MFCCSPPVSHLKRNYWDFCTTGGELWGLILIDFFSLCLCAAAHPDKTTGDADLSQITDSDEAAERCLHEAQQNKTSQSWTLDRTKKGFFFLLLHGCAFEYAPAVTCRSKQALHVARNENLGCLETASMNIDKL